LGNVLIVEDIETALDISNECLGKYKIISLNGMVINIDGSVEIYSNSVNLENIKDSFYDVEKEIENLEKEIEALKIKIFIEENNHIYDSLWKENQEIKRLLRENEKNTADSINNLHQVTISINELKDSLKDLLIEEKSILGERKKVSEKLGILEKNYNILYKYSKNISHSNRTINQIIARGNNRLNNLYREINDLKNNILINKEKLKNIKEKTENISQYQDEHSFNLSEKRSSFCI